MDLSSAISKAYSTKWSYINNFRVQITFADEINSYINWNSNSEEYDIFIKDISTPQLSNSPIEVFFANDWRYHTGRPELCNLTITFRDFDQMKLYKKIMYAYWYQQRMYFDDCKFTVSLWKGADYASESENKLYEFKDCIISSVSQVQFSNETEAQIAEFSIEVKTHLPVPNTNFV